MYLLIAYHAWVNINYVAFSLCAVHLFHKHISQNELTITLLVNDNILTLRNEAFFISIFFFFVHLLFYYFIYYYYIIWNLFSYHEWSVLLHIIHTKPCKALHRPAFWFLQHANKISICFNSVFSKTETLYY